MATPVAAEQRLNLLSPVWPHYTEIEVEHAQGCYIYGSDGTRYLDFTSGIAVTNTGHCHPRVVAAIQAQAARLLHGQATVVRHRPMLELAEALKQVLPDSLDCFFFTNSGSEAVESALKLARHATGRSNIIAFQGGYHGRTVGAMAVTTAKTVYRHGYQPLMSGVYISPFPDAYRYRRDPEAVAQWCLEELRHLLATQTAPGETAAMIVEPVLGEGGYVVPPASFLKGLREICDQHGILLIFDEIQTGFGRTGKYFAFEHTGVVPDVLLMAKGLASGLPLSGIVAPRSLMERWLPASHGGTYGGNAVAVAAAVATMRVLREEGLVEHAARTGAYLLGRLQALQHQFPVLGDVRGLGLMIGCEFTTPDGQPDRRSAKRVRDLCLESGLLLITCGTYDNVIRWIPPLIATGEQIDESLIIFESALKRLDTGDASR